MQSDEGAGKDECLLPDDAKEHDEQGAQLPMGALTTLPQVMPVATPVEEVARSEKVARSVGLGAGVVVTALLTPPLLDAQSCCQLPIGGLSLAPSACTMNLPLKQGASDEVASRNAVMDDIAEGLTTSIPPAVDDVQSESQLPIGDLACTRSDCGMSPPALKGGAALSPVVATGHSDGAAAIGGLLQLVSSQVACQRRVCRIRVLFHCQPVAMSMF